MSVLVAVVALPVVSASISVVLIVESPVSVVALLPIRCSELVALDFLVTDHATKVAFPLEFLPVFLALNRRCHCRCFVVLFLRCILDELLLELA